MASRFRICPAAAMSKLFAIFGKYRDHAILFGGGLLGGLLVFLVWFAMQPSLEQSAPAVDAAANANAAKPVRDKDGVLGDIAGGMAPGNNGAVVDLETAPTEEAPADAGSEGDSTGTDPEVAAPPSDEDAIAGGLLGPGDGPPPPPMQTWYVEVARGPGVTEVLEISAPTPEQALGVVRDFRGNPRVLRGPSNQPLP